MLVDAAASLTEPCWRLLARAMTSTEVTGRPSLLAVSQVLSILRSSKASELELSKCKTMLTGPVSAPWKPPAELQPVTKEASFANQIKGFPMENVAKVRGWSLNMIPYRVILLIVWLGLYNLED